jgi:hypothetical protein
MEKGFGTLSAFTARKPSIHLTLNVSKGILDDVGITPVKPCVEGGIISD